MSGREWAPGDVAMVGKLRALRVAVGEITSAPAFITEDGEELQVTLSDPRPLVVIDPEDREQVERLVLLLVENGWQPSLSDGCQAALREFANPTPPKPDEPTGLGAVVEDADGRRWVRFCDSWRLSGDPAGYRSYLAIDAVRVLAEGVQP